MKTIFKTALSLSVVLLAAACSLTEIDTQMTAEQAIAAIRLDCSADAQYTIPAERAQVITFHVTSTTPWTITGQEGNEDWLTLSPASSSVSSLSEDIRVSVKINEGYEDRVANLTVSGANTKITHVVNITQLRKGRFAVTPVTSDISAAGAPVTFTVTTNLDWTAEAEDDWLVFDKSSGEGKDGVPQTVSVSAPQNPDLSRDTKVTVKAGEFSQSFTVKQNGGVALDFVLDGEPVVDRKGVEPLMIGVNAVPWTFECDNPVFTVEKVSDTQLKVTAPWNNKFAPVKAKITIKPTDASLSKYSRSLDIEQGINFRLSGNCEVQEDGSVKLISNKESRVTTLDNYRFASVVLKMGDKNFEDHAQLWCAVKADGCNIYNQITLGGNIRLRTDGNLPVSGTSTYDNVKYTITKSELNAMMEYRFDVLPDPDHATWHIVNFYYNETKRATLNTEKSLDVFKDSPEAEGQYYFGFNSEGYTEDGSWYIVKTCDITPIAEN